MVYSLPKYFKQIEEIREHHDMLKDLKYSRTLPILPSVSISTLNFNDYWFWNLSVVSVLQPKLILPSPSPLHEERELFSFQPEKVNENTCESTPVGVMWSQPMTLGSFSQELNVLYPIY